MKHLFLALALSVGPLDAYAEPLPLTDLSAYIESIVGAESSFTQINADGSKTTGRVIIRRPNRMRFEYAPPDRTLVLASAGQVAIFDPKSNQPPEQYPLKRTPLNLILARNVDLTRAKMVVAHAEEDGMTTVTAQDPENPDYGTITLYFTDGPIDLRQWVVTDGGGARTRVILDGLAFGGNYGASLFSIENETKDRIGSD
jgi:outer membrane lipoprotein-sorting protein